MLRPLPVERADWPALAAFIFRHNRSADGLVRCLHGDQGHDEAAHAIELAELQSDAAAFWRIAGEGGETLGVIGCTIDAGQQRAWVRGPWAVPDPSSAPFDATLQPSTALEAVLLDSLERGLPTIHRLDAFPSADDAALCALYGAAGYTLMGVHRVMQAALTDAVEAAAVDPRIGAAQPDDLPHWLPLHHDLFPGSYLPDHEIVAAVADDTRLVLTAWLDGRPAGYLIANDDATMDELYVDFIGTDPGARGRGLGSGLLRHALRWGRARGRSVAALTVRQDREQALSLYRQCGFEQISAGLHWRKDRAPMATAPPAER